VAAAVGGILDTSRVLTAQASNGGSSLTFTVLAGVVVGGTSIAGGEGAVWRTVVGVLFIALINNGFDLLGVDPLYQQMVLGLILLLAVGLDSWARASTRRRLSGALTSTLRTLRLTGPSGELLPEGAPAVAEGEGSVSAGASTKGSG
ncbi:MAG: hypothetical protein J2P57_14415, partial [Acidimicrobiaceae bacterium]|nr:hypothetical protein [Acidimicrobiaceae bacterium]